jgi:hypothetical protein
MSLELEGDPRPMPTSLLTRIKLPASPLTRIPAMVPDENAGYGYLKGRKIFVTRRFDMESRTSTT